MVPLYITPSLNPGGYVVQVWSTTGRMLGMVPVATRKDYRLLMENVAGVLLNADPNGVVWALFDGTTGDRVEPEPRP